MPEALLLKPNRKFVDEVVNAGGGDLKKCFQCATCSVVCGLSNESSPFPRKEMIWAQWGLKDRLVSDPDLWLCHQCNDCSLRCPRGARPGDVLAAVRQKAIEHYAFPCIMGRWVNSVRAAPMMLALLPALILFLALLVRGPVEGALGFSEAQDTELYAAFFPHWLLIATFTTLTLLTFGGLIVGLVRFWKGMKAADQRFGRGQPLVGLMPSLTATLKNIFTHERFGTCTDRASRKSAHLMAFYGFLALFIVTCWAVMDLYVMPRLGVASDYPFGLVHPMKLLANIGGILLILGAGKVLLDRMRAPADGRHQSTSFDWIFAWLLFLVGITGFVVEILRFTVSPGPVGTAQSTAYGIYFVHLVLVFGLLVYLPYSKFAHMWYRAVAMVYAEHTGRTGKGSQLVKV